MSLELTLIIVLGLVVLAEAAMIWMLWQRPTPTDSSQEVAALRARVAALSTPDLGPLHQMVSRLESELAELKEAAWRGHPARAEAVSSGVTESLDAGETPAVLGSPLLRPGDSANTELGGGGEGLGERSDGEPSIEVPSPDSGEGQGGGAGLQTSGNPDADRLPAVRIDGSPLLLPGDSANTESRGGGEGLGERSDGELSIEVPSPDSGEGQGGGAGLQTSGNPDADRLPAVRMSLQNAATRAEELLKQAENPTDRAYLTGLHERLVHASQAKDLEEWDNDRTLIFGLYQPISDIGPHELSDDLRPTVQEISSVLDESRAEAIDHLRVKFGVEVIAPVVGTPFDPLVHEDSPTTRLTPPSPDLAHTIYARVGLGLKRGDEVIEKAWVKRYAGYEGPLENQPLTEKQPSLPPPYLSPVPGEGTPDLNDNAAKSLLQQAAEHAE